MNLFLFCVMFLSKKGHFLAETAVSETAETAETAVYSQKIAKKAFKSFLFGAISDT